MRESQRQKLLQKGFGKAQKKINQKRYKCLLPSCNKTAIKSHSQQKQHQLNAISENSMVYSLEKNIYKIFKSSNEDITERELLVKKAIGEASRYIGFCNIHDTNIFSPIENGSLNIELQEHNLLLFLRCFSYEFSNKRSACDWAKIIIEENRSLFGPEGTKTFQDYTAEVKLFIERDAPHYLSKLFECYQTRDYSLISSRYFNIPKNIGVSSSTCFSPLMEKHDTWMAKNFDSVQPIVSLSLVPDSEKTSIAFVWLSEFDYLCNEISILNQGTDDLSKVVNMYVLTESEDICIRPSIWENTSSEARKKIYRHMGNNNSVEEGYNSPQLIEF